MELLTEPMTAAEFERWTAVVRAHLIAIRTGNAPGDPAAVADRVLQSLHQQGKQQLWRFVEGGEQIGSAWLVEQGGGAAMYDLQLPPDRVSEGLELLTNQASAQGWRRLDTSAYRGDVVGAAVKRAGAELVATKMSIRVNDVPDGTIELRPMTEDRFERFIDDGIEHYAHSIFDAGGFETIETARLASLEEHKRLLPQGLQSPGHRLWSAFDAADPTQEVGLLWVQERPNHGFIYDIAVDPAHQRKGYGTHILRGAAAEMRFIGREALWLNVFGHNADARRLYEREGYAVNEEIVRIPVGSDG